jgi:lipopolysaccharide/colanic/teichoic acid biosynthesis glycosyltransferase
MSLDGAPPSRTLLSLLRRSGAHDAATLTTSDDGAVATTFARPPASAFIAEAVRAARPAAIEYERPVPEVIAAPFTYALFKRALDITVATACLLFALPSIVAIAVAIKLTSPGPVFIRQERLGKDAKPFGMLKFRSMYVNDGNLPDDLKGANESTGPLFKLRNDPRVTRVGYYLRRASLDELPQLINVLRGEMSLVGPRPPLARELAGYEAVQRERLRVLPGLTGLWQVSGRSNLPFEDMVRLDLEYIERRSFGLDLWILARTVPCVLRGEGAY